MRHAKEQESMTHIQGEKKSGNRNCFRKGSDVRLNKDFKTAIIGMFKEVKKTVLKEVKEGVMPMCHQIEDINKEMKIIFKKEPNGNSGIEKYNDQGEKFTGGVQ